MTVNQNDFDPGFDLGELESPPSIYWPGYFWSLNDKLELGEMLVQLRDMHCHGAKSVCIHPMPPEFRPDTSATMIRPPYLGKDYFKIIRAVADEAAALGMNFYLYDEVDWNKYL